MRDRSASIQHFREFVWNVQKELGLSWTGSPLKSKISEVCREFGLVLHCIDKYGPAGIEELCAYHLWDESMGDYKLDPNAFMIYLAFGEKYGYISRENSSFHITDKGRDVLIAINSYRVEDMFDEIYRGVVSKYNQIKENLKTPTHKKDL